MKKKYDWSSAIPMASQEAEDTFKLLDSINFSFRNALLIFFMYFFPFLCGCSTLHFHVFSRNWPLSIKLRSTSFSNNLPKSVFTIFLITSFAFYLLFHLCCAPLYWSHYQTTHGEKSCSSSLTCFLSGSRATPCHFLVSLTFFCV